MRRPPPWPTLDPSVSTALMADFDTLVAESAFSGASPTAEAPKDPDAACPSTGSLAAGSCLLWLGDDERELVLSFVISQMSAFARVAAAGQQVWRDAHSPGAWRGASVVIKKQNLGHPCGIKGIMQLSKVWGLAREVRLPPHQERRLVHRELRLMWPELTLRTVGEGPYLLFVMGSYLLVGDAISLHFFEPRYTWMCRRLFEGEAPYTFGFVTRGGPRGGGGGVLCSITRHTMNEDGTFDVYVTATTSFSLLEVWQEEVPGLPAAPPLALGFVEILRDKAPVDGRAARAPEEGGEGARPPRSRRTALAWPSCWPCCSLGIPRMLRCCRRRGWRPSV